MRKGLFAFTVLCLLLSLVFPSAVMAKQDVSLNYYELGVEDLVQHWFQDQDRYEIRFVAPAEFTQLELEILSDDYDDSILKITFYQWDRNLDRTVAGTSVSELTVVGDFYTSGLRKYPLANALPAGEYLMVWEVEKSAESAFGMYGKTSIFDYVETYQDGDEMLGQVDHFLFGITCSVEEGTTPSWQALSPVVTEVPTSEPTATPTPPTDEATPTLKPTSTPAGTVQPSGEEEGSTFPWIPIIVVVFVAAAVVVVIVLIRKKKAS